MATVITTSDEANDDHYCCLFFSIAAAIIFIIIIIIIYLWTFVIFIFNLLTVAVVVYVRLSFCFVHNRFSKSPLSVVESYRCGAKRIDCGDLVMKIYIFVYLFKCL